MTKSIARKIADIEDNHNRTLTNRQREFAKLYVEGIYSGSECARRAGFSKIKANVYASKLLNGRDNPHVAEYVKELREPKWKTVSKKTDGKPRPCENYKRTYLPRFT